MVVAASAISNGTDIRVARLGGCPVAASGFNGIV
jgi:hypothetical protein